MVATMNKIIAMYKVQIQQLKDAARCAANELLVNNLSGALPDNEYERDCSLLEQFHELELKQAYDSAIAAVCSFVDIPETA